MANGKNALTIKDKRQSALKTISDEFAVVETVRALRGMMDKVTEKEMNPDTVNAACNCVQNINLTIKTSIQAAKFLADND